jgi:hypothetical protein
MFQGVELTMLVLILMKVVNEERDVVETSFTSINGKTERTGISELTSNRELHA